MTKVVAKITKNGGEHNPCQVHTRVSPRERTIQSALCISFPCNYLQLRGSLASSARVEPACGRSDNEKGKAVPPADTCLTDLHIIRRSLKHRRETERERESAVKSIGV
jgi:hypothetical protein